MVVIGLLADHPEALATVTHWLHRAWMRHFGHTLDQARAEMHSRMGRDSLPLALVARVGKAVVGTVSISADHGAAAAPSTWCLAGLYVTPRWRHRGIATRLCAVALERAAGLGLSTLGLYTQDRAGFFFSQGWRVEGEVALQLSGVPQVVTRMSRAVPLAGPHTAG